MADRASSVRIVDPVLTQVVQGYRNAEAIFGRLFPKVSVAVEGFKVPTFTPAAFKLWIAKRGIRATRARVEFPIESTTDCVLDEYSLEEAIDRRERDEAMRNPAGGALYIKNKQAQSQRLKSQIDLNFEIVAATLLQATANYASGHSGTPSTLWSAGGATPLADIFTAKNTVRAAIGIEPRKFWMGHDVWKIVRTHSDFMNLIKYSQKGVITTELMAQLLDCDEVIVGNMVKSTDGTTITDVWGKYAGWIYTPPQAEADRETPSLGYLFEKIGYPGVWTYSDERSNAPDVLVVETIGTIKQLSSSAGYLFDTPVA